MAGRIRQEHLREDTVASVVQQLGEVVPRAGCQLRARSQNYHHNVGGLQHLQRADQSLALAS